MNSLIWRDGSGVEVATAVENARKVDTSVLPSVDHFAVSPGGAEAIRLDRPARLPADVLEVITTQRATGIVTLRVDELDRLVIGAADEAAAPLTVDGPGFTTHLGHRNVVLSLPYFAALALYNSVGLRAVSVWVSGKWGTVIHEGMMVQLVWPISVEPANHAGSGTPGG